MTDDRSDKRTLGVTAQGAVQLDALMGTGWFNEEVDAYRVAISVAIARGLDKSPAEVTGVTTKWNVGTLDPRGDLRTLISTMEKASPERPYAAAELRAAAGLEFLKERLVDGRDKLSDVLGAPE